jgi:hypothetical protein
MAKTKRVILGVFLLTLFASSVLAKSNCYIKLDPSRSGNIGDNRKLIESYGGRIIHEFPETNEYICEMALSQVERFVQNHAAFGEHKSLDIPYTRSFSKHRANSTRTKER